MKIPHLFFRQHAVLFMAPHQGKAELVKNLAVRQTALELNRRMLSTTNGKFYAIGEADFD